MTITLQRITTPFDGWYVAPCLVITDGLFYDKLSHATSLVTTCLDDGIRVHINASPHTLVFALTLELTTSPPIQSESYIEITSDSDWVLARLKFE